MSWIIYILIFIIFSWLISRQAQTNALTTRDFLTAFSIKVFYGVLYLLIFTYYFSNGTIYGDTYRFLQDALVIKDIAYQDLGVFLKLFTGLGQLNQQEVHLFLESTQIWDYGNNGDWINDNRLIIRVNTFIHFFSMGNPYIHALVFSFLSFTGIRLVYQAFHKFVPNKKIFWYALVLWPSIGFWGGSILKETLLVFGIGLFFFSLFSILSKEKKSRHFFYLAVAIGILAFNKPYAGLFIICLTLVYIFGHSIQWRRNGLMYGAIGIAGLFIVLTTAPLSPNLTERLSRKQNDLNNLGKGGIAFITDSSFCVFNYDLLNHFELEENKKISVISTAEGQYKLFGKNKFYDFTISPSDRHYDVYLIYAPSTSYFKTNPINNSASVLYQSIPGAIINVLIRPFPWDNGDPLKIMSFVFNIILLILLIFSILKRRKISSEEKYILFTLFSISLFITVIIGLSIPIFGAIVRYKLPVELFLIISSLIILKPLHHEKNNH